MYIFLENLLLPLLLSDNFFNSKSIRVVPHVALICHDFMYNVILLFINMFNEVHKDCFNL
jgi:hypothetical protein